MKIGAQHDVFISKSCGKLLFQCKIYGMFSTSFSLWNNVSVYRGLIAMCKMHLCYIYTYICCWKNWRAVLLDLYTYYTPNRWHPPEFLAFSHHKLQCSPLQDWMAVILYLNISFHLNQFYWMMVGMYCIYAEYIYACVID